jgi:hypothetical protein
MKNSSFGLKNYLFGLFFGFALINCDNDSPSMNLYETKGFINDSIYVHSYEKNFLFEKNKFVMEIIPISGKDVSYSFVDLNKDKEFDYFVVNRNLEKKVFSKDELPQEVSSALQKRYKSYLDSAFTKRIKGLVYGK